MTSNSLLPAGELGTRAYQQDISQTDKQWLTAEKHAADCICCIDLPNMQRMWLQNHEWGLLRWFTILADVEKTWLEWRKLLLSLFFFFFFPMLLLPAVRRIISVLLSHQLISSLFSLHLWFSFFLSVCQFQHETRLHTSKPLHTGLCGFIIETSRMLDRQFSPKSFCWCVS